MPRELYFVANDRPNGAQIAAPSDYGAVGMANSIAPPNAPSTPLAPIDSCKDGEWPHGIGFAYGHGQLHCESGRTWCSRNDALSVLDQYDVAAGGPGPGPGLFEAGNDHHIQFVNSCTSDSERLLPDSVIDGHPGPEAWVTNAFCTESDSESDLRPSLSQSLPNQEPLAWGPAPAGPRTQLNSPVQFQNLNQHVIQYGIASNSTLPPIRNQLQVGIASNSSPPKKKTRSAYARAERAKGICYCSVCMRASNGAGKPYQLRTIRDHKAKDIERIRKLRTSDNLSRQRLSALRTPFLNAATNLGVSATEMDSIQLAFETMEVKTVISLPSRHGLECRDMSVSAAAVIPEPEEHFSDVSAMFNGAVHSEPPVTVADKLNPDSEPDESDSESVPDSDSESVKPRESDDAAADSEPLTHGLQSSIEAFVKTVDESLTKLMWSLCTGLRIMSTSLRLKGHLKNW